ncbi:hypothetical protein L345_00536 [Ophiophagus hannah]|uniref:Uncharacterized protein n=1 Tax=Ophiophagus hannah TaxID=8665 RepID=V8PGD9_OPHHA|nr:hypothetical protein L345_00536 [Ophiophagus hannah]
MCACIFMGGKTHSVREKRRFLVVVERSDAVQEFEVVPAFNAIRYVLVLNFSPLREIGGKEINYQAKESEMVSESDMCSSCIKSDLQITAKEVEPSPSKALFINVTSGRKEGDEKV